MKDFESVWQQIREVAEMKKGEGIFTLSESVHNQIGEVNDNFITVISEKPYRSVKPKSRELPKDSFKKVWKTLKTNKEITCRNDQEVIVPHQRIIMSFLSYLPNITYSLKPQTLYFTESDTRKLGTRLEVKK